MRKTNQRQQILTYLSKTKDHPTAEQVYEELIKTMPMMSRATVYRNLSQLAKTKRVRAISTAHATHYDGQTQPHQHAVCEECQTIIDIPEFIIQQPKIRGFIPHKTEVTIKGLCTTCNGGKNHDV